MVLTLPALTKILSFTVYGQTESVIVPANETKTITSGGDTVTAVADETANTVTLTRVGADATVDVCYFEGQKIFGYVEEDTYKVVR